MSLRKKFVSLPVNEGDELFANGIFEFNITRILVHIAENPDAFPVQEYEVGKLRTFPRENLSDVAIRAANLAIPIILAEIRPGWFNVIDGNHRLEKAGQNMIDKIKAYSLTAEQHTMFLTSEASYRAYVKYWNSKL